MLGLALLPEKSRSKISSAPLLHLSYEFRFRAYTSP